MTIRFNEKDINTTGSNKILLLDENGKIPALDGSALTNITPTGYNGLSYNYTTTNATIFTPSIDAYYYIPQANKKSSLGGNSVSINIPYSSNIINGSKFGFTYIHTNGYDSGNKYLLITPTNESLINQGWSSFVLNIYGKEYTNGEIYYSDDSANPNREFYAFVDGTNLTWFAATGGHHKITDSRLFDLNNTNPYSMTKHHMLVTKNASTYSTTNGNTNVPNVVFKEFTTNTTLSFTNNTLPDGYRHYFITCNNTTNVNPVITVPLASASEGIFITFYASYYWGSNTTNYSSFTVSRQGTSDVFRFNSSGATPTSFIVSPNTNITIFSTGAFWYIMSGSSFSNQLLY